MKANPITYGSQIRLRNGATKKLLATVDRVNPKREGQNLVVGVGVSKDTCVWEVHGALGASVNLVSSKTEIKDLDTIRLFNLQSSRRLHSHKDTALADPNTQEVTTFKGGQPPGAGDPNDNWQIILVSPSAFYPGGRVRLRHAETGKYLYSSLAKSALFAEDESNISAVDGPSEGTEWILLEALVDLPTPVLPEELLRQIEERLERTTSLYESAQEELATIRGWHAEAAEKSAHINSGARFADEKRNEIENLKATLDGSTVAIREAAAQSKAHHEQMSAYMTSARIAADNAVAASEKSTKLGAIAEDVDAKVKGYESELQSRLDRAAAMEKKIEDVYAGATSVGLGKAFQDRANEYDKEFRRWRLAALGVLVCTYRACRRRRNISNCWRRSV